MSSRACLRCISKKRKCDHKRPSCGLCSKLGLGCEYPPPQARRGPVAGLGKKAEARVQQCENALWWVLSLPDVADAVRRHADSTPLPRAPTARLERIARAGWWDEHGIRSAADVLAFATAARELAATAGDEGDAHEPEPEHEHEHDHDHEHAPSPASPSALSERTSLSDPHTDTPRLPLPPLRSPEHHAHHAYAHRSPPSDPHLYQHHAPPQSPPPSYAQSSRSPRPPPHPAESRDRPSFAPAPKRELDDDDVPRHEIRRPALWNLIAAADRDDWRQIKRQRTAAALW